MKSFSESHLDDAVKIIEAIDKEQIERLAREISRVASSNGRIFFIGVGGSSGNCSHAVNDFRKICGIESYAPTDNVSELTARANDEGWETIFSEWLKVSRLCQDDAVFVMSVGGGSLESNISTNIVRALEYALSVNSSILGIVGRDGGFAKRVGKEVLVVPTVNSKTITPHTEAFQAVIWHLLVSHPLLQKESTKWESATDGI